MKTTLLIGCSVFLVTFISTGQTRKGSTPLASLVEAERTFAKTSVAKGARPSFMRFFADDAMVFRPHPVNYKEAMKNVPAPKNPLEATLGWQPIFADVARSGELGYTTGPSEWIDHSSAKRPPYYGFYFSFWKKQSSGEWKVVFDVGTEIPGPYHGSKKFRSPAVTSDQKSDRTVDESISRASLMKVEADFSTAADNMGTQKAFDMFVDAGARFYRQKENPIVGREAFGRYFSAKPYLSTWQSLGCDVSKSGELGYVYGSYVVKGMAEKPVDGEKGYYLRAWKRDADDNWKLVAEVLSPLPPKVPNSKE